MSTSIASKVGNSLGAQDTMPASATASALTAPCAGGSFSDVLPDPHSASACVYCVSSRSCLHLRRASEWSARRVVGSQSQTESSVTCFDGPRHRRIILPPLVLARLLVIVERFLAVEVSPALRAIKLAAACGFNIVHRHRRSLRVSLACAARTPTGKVVVPSKLSRLACRLLLRNVVVDLVHVALPKVCSARNMRRRCHPGFTSRRGCCYGATCVWYPSHACTAFSCSASRASSASPPPSGGPTEQRSWSSHFWRCIVSMSCSRSAFRLFSVQAARLFECPYCGCALDCPPPKALPSDHIAISYVKLSIINKKKPQMDGLLKTKSGGGGQSFEGSNKTARRRRCV